MADNNAARATALGKSAVESVCNTAVEFDSRSAKKQTACVSSYLSRLAIELSECSDTYPDDDLMQIMMYAFPAIKDILSSPREKMYRIPEMIPQQRVHSFSRKSLTWLSKRPGRTVREKIISSPKVLSQTKRFSYDTPENRAFAYLVKHLAEALNTRTKKAAEETNSAGRIINQLNAFERLWRQFRRSELSDIPAVLPAAANNALLSDKNYKKIYKAISMYKELRSRIEPNPDELLSAFVYSAAAAVSAEIYSKCDVLLFDGRKEWMNALPTELLYTNPNGKPCILKISVERNALIIRSVRLRHQTASVMTEGNPDLCLCFSFSIENQPTNENIGLPITVQVDDCQMHTYADLQGLNDCVAAIFDFVCQNRIDERRNDVKDEKLQNALTVDFTTYDVRFLRDKDDIPHYCIGACEAIPAKNCLYDIRDGVVSVHSLTDPNPNGDCSPVPEYYSRLSNQMELTYLVSDSADVFEQKNQRRLMGLYFGRRSFPVWKSIAATEIVRARPKQNNLRKFCIIEPADPDCTMTIVAIRKDGYPERMPPNTLGDSDVLSEDILAEQYLRKFAERYLQSENLTEEDFKSILSTGQINRLCSGETTKAEVYLKSENGWRRITIALDTSILFPLNHLAAKKLKALMELPEIKNSGVPVLICNSASLRDCITMRKEVSIDFCGTHELLISAQALADRYHAGQKTWFEHLPRLDFIVPKGGRYCKLSLISPQNCSVDAARSEVRINVEETMVLPADNKKMSYEFPLLKEDLGRENRVVAQIKSPAFPLTRDLCVSMELIYRYGYEDTYELILRPAGEDKPFTELKAEWISPKSQTKKDSAIPVSQTPMSESNIMLLCDKYEYQVQQMIKQIELSKKYADFNVEILRICARRLCGIMRRMIRETQLENNERINTVLDSFEQKLLMPYYHIIFDADDRLYPNVVRTDNEAKDIMLYSMALFTGLYCCEIPEIDRFFSSEMFKSDYLAGIKKADKKRYDLVCSFTMQHYLMYCEDKEIWDRYIKNFFSEGDNNLRRSLLRSFSIMFWQNPKTLERIHDDYPEVLNWICWECAAFIRKSARDKIKDAKALKLTRDYMETLLAVLSLRTKRGFGRFQTGSNEALRLADAIKEYDMQLYEAGEFTSKDGTTTFCQEYNRITRVQLEVTQPQALCKMTVLCYVLEVSLTGEEGADTIRVLDFVDE